jgi:hypothetical protein
LTVFQAPPVAAFPFRFCANIVLLPLEGLCH